MRSKSTFVGVLLCLALVLACGAARSAEMSVTDWSTVPDTQQDLLKISFGRTGASKTVFARVFNGYSFRVSGSISFDLVNGDTGEVKTGEYAPFNAKAGATDQQGGNWFSLPGEKMTVQGYSVRNIRIRELRMPMMNDLDGQLYLVYPTNERAAAEQRQGNAGTKQNNGAATQQTSDTGSLSYNGDTSGTFSNWASLSTGNGVQARVRRIGSKTANGQYLWAWELRNGTNAPLDFTYSVSGQQGPGNDDKRSGLLAPGAIVSGQEYFVAENTIYIHAAPVTSPSSQDPPKESPQTASSAMSEKDREAKMEELVEKMTSGIADIDPADPGAALARMQVFAEQLLELMAQDPDNDNKRLAQLFLAFSKADPEQQTSILTQIMQLVMAMD